MSGESTKVVFKTHSRSWASQGFTLVFHVGETCHGCPTLPLFLALAACTPDDASPPTDPITVPQTTVIASGPLACADPDARQDLGGFATTTVPLPPAEQADMIGSGLIVADLANDGWPDIVFLTVAGPMLLTNGPDGLANAVQPLPGAPALSALAGGAAADIDDDGDIDLFLTRWNGVATMLRNDDGQFVDITAEAGFPTEPLVTVAAAFGDVDGDGHLDLWVGNYADPAGSDEEILPSNENEVAGEITRFRVPGAMWMGQGDGTFVAEHDRLPQACHDSFPMAGGLHDFDADGDLDLFVGTDFGWRGEPNQLYLNDGTGQFSTTPADRGTQMPGAGMGLAVGDMNGDGALEFAVSFVHRFEFLESRRVDDVPIWLNSTLGRFRQGAYRQTYVAWAMELADVDNDADLDLLVNWAHLDPFNSPGIQPDQLWRNMGTSFTDVAPRFGVADEGADKALAVVDLNRDGWLDLVKPDVRGQGIVHMARCGEEAWLTVSLEQEAPNRNAIGARVAVLTDQTQTRAVVAGGTSFAYGGPPEVHVGLAQAESAEVVVVWPDGTRESLGEVQTRQRLHIVRGQHHFADVSMASDP